MQVYFKISQHFYTNLVVVYYTNAESNFKKGQKMKSIDIYTTQVCPYCVRAKALLDRKGATYSEIRVDLDDDMRAEMMERSGGRRTVPQIFIGDYHVGGCDDLHALDKDGKLDELLAA